MSFSRELFRGMSLALKLTSPPLYHYPYRNSMEAFRSDWKHIGGDIQASFDMFEGAGGGEDNNE